MHQFVVIVWSNASWPQMTFFVPLLPPAPEASEAGNRISPQAKPWPDFFNDTAINPWNAHASKNSKALMKKQIDHICLHMWLCLQATITAMIETGPVQAATFV